MEEEQKIIQLTAAQEQVISLIGTDKTNPTTRAQLKEMTGYSIREIKYILASLRKTYPICSQMQSPGGYWIATEKKDVVQFIHDLQSQVAGYHETMDNLLITAKKLNY
jgi:predicted HTH transcriptional regulator